VPRLTRFQPMTAERRLSKMLVTHLIWIEPCGGCCDVLLPESVDLLRLVAIPDKLIASLEQLSEQ
jgi:hypothetical protein